MSFAHPSLDPHLHTDPSGARSARAPGIASKLLMLALLVLAVAATVIMFFVDSEFWLNIAVIAALWAAFIGAVLVSRYSGVVGDEDSRIEALDARYQAELDAERAEHRRREAELESDYATRREAGRDETLESIRSELAAMRAQLADLSGLDLSDEQVAVRARAERIIELERRSSQVEPTIAEGLDTVDTPESEARISQESPSAPRVESRRGPRRGGFATGSFSAVRWSGTDSQDTTMIPLVVDTNTDDGELDSTTSSGSLPEKDESAPLPHRGGHEASEKIETPVPDVAEVPVEAVQSVEPEKFGTFSGSSRESEVVSMPTAPSSGSSGSHRNGEASRSSGSESPSHDGSTSRRARRERNHRAATSGPDLSAVAEVAPDAAHEANQEQASEYARRFAPEPTGRTKFTAPAARAEHVEPLEQAEPAVEERHHRRRAEDDVSDNVRGRRRAEEQDDPGSVTVAELMAQLKKNSQ